MIDDGHGRGKLEPRVAGAPRGPGRLGGGAGAPARRGAAPDTRRDARPAPGAPRGVRSARQCLGGRQRPGAVGAVVPRRAQAAAGRRSALAPRRRPCAAGAQAPVGGVPGEAGGRDAAARDHPGAVSRGAGPPRCSDIVHPFVKYLESRGCVHRRCDSLGDAYAPGPHPLQRCEWRRCRAPQDRSAMGHTAPPVSPRGGHT